MKRLNPEYVERVIGLANGSPYFQLISMKICELGLDHSVLEIDLDRTHLQPFGQAHGGVFASIIDAAAFWAGFGSLEQDAGMISVDLKLNFLAPAESGKLIARGRRIKLGRTLGYAEAEVTDGDGKLVAHGTSTLIVLQGRAVLSPSPPLPPKFLD